MLFGYFLFGIVPVLLKQGLHAGVEPGLAVVLRFLVALLLLGALVLAGMKLKGVNRKGLFWRGLFGGLAVASFFYAVQLCGAGLGTLLNYTHSLWANVFAVLIFHQRPDRWFWPLLALAAAGLWLVVDPGGGNFQWFGLGLGIFSGMVAGAAVLSIKALRKTDSALTINAALTVGGLAVGLPLALLGLGLHGTTTLPAQSAPWLWVAGSALFSFFGQLFFNHGFKVVSVAMGSLLSLLTPAMACLSGWYFLGEAMTPHFVLGSVLILAACGLLGWRESRPTKRALLLKNAPQI